MAVSLPKGGYNTWIDEANPNTPHPNPAAIFLDALVGARCRGFLWMPLPRKIAGSTIATAPLTGTAHAALLAQTLTFQAVGTRWDAATLSWTDQPSAIGSAITVTLAAGQTFTIDMAPLVQPVADGTFDNFGWRILTSITTAAQKLEAFDGSGVAFSLEVHFTEPPEIPTVLHPNGTVVSVPKPVVTTDFTDLGDTDDDIAFIQVQVDTNGDGTVDWDSGQLATTVPVLDLAAAGMTGTISSGQTVKWRAKVWNSNGDPSADFSAWATYTYKTPITLTFDSPAGGTIYDPTSDVLAHASGGNLDAWRLWILDADDPTIVRYDSRKQPATSPTAIAAPIPLRNDDGALSADDGALIFRDDKDYVIRLRGFDDQHREATPGVPAWTQIETTVHFDDNLALDRPTSYQVDGVDDTPFVRHTWTDVAAADAYLISRDGKIAARLEPADVVAGVSTYSWVDLEAEPFITHVYELRRITAGVGRSKPRRTQVTIEAPGVWLLRSNGHYACLLGDPPATASYKDRRSIYKPTNLSGDVDVITGFEGLSDDSWSHWIEDHYPMPGGQTVDQTKAVLDAIKQHPHEKVRLIFASFSKPVRLRNLSVVPHTDYVLRTKKHAVTFGVTQAGEFDYRAPS
jgi:hypothetical protein